MLSFRKFFLIKQNLINNCLYLRGINQEMPFWKPEKLSLIFKGSWQIKRSNILLNVFSWLLPISVLWYLIIDISNKNNQRDSNPQLLALTPQLNYLVSLAKWLSVRLRTKSLRVRVTLQSLKRQISRLLRARSSLTFRQM